MNGTQIIIFESHCTVLVFIGFNRTFKVSKWGKKAHPHMKILTSHSKVNYVYM